MSTSNPAKDMWLAALELLRTRGDFSDSQFAFARMAHPLAVADDIFMIVVGSEFVKSWLEEHAVAKIVPTLSDILGRQVRVVISVDPSVNETSSSPVDDENTSSNYPRPSQQRHQPNHKTDFSADITNENSTHHQDMRPLTQPPTDNLPPEFSPHHNRPDTDLFSQSSSPDYAPYNIHNPTDTEFYGNKNNPAFITASTKAGLNPKYTFETFVIGESNRFPTATSLAVAEVPGTTYNPLFLYADSGMGKTHLMHAIGNYALSLYEDIRIKYVSAEEFTNAFINAVRDGRQAEFKDTFRKVDILLIDDIQFIGGRDTTVEEFFHTFNALTNSNKQIVITSDVAPNLLNGFEERMLSRFSSGLVAKVDRPNLETRIAILEKKAHVDGIQVPREVHEYIATNMTTNVREMEGALRRVTAFSDLSSLPVSLKIAEMVLKDLISNPDAIEITPTMIMGQTANYFRINIDDLTGSNRSKLPVTARQIAMYLCREMTDMSLPKIGSIFGGRDHTTVMHAYKKIDKQMSERQTTYNQVSELSIRIKQAASNEKNS